MRAAAGILPSRGSNRTVSIDPITPGERPVWVMRSVVLGFVVVTAFSILLVRCYWLQLLEGDYYSMISESNALHSRVLRPPRGVILDRRGVVLATNLPSFDVVFIPRGVRRPDYDRVAAEIAGLTGQPPEELLQKMLSGRRRPLTSVLLASDISRRVLSAVEENRADLPGVFVEDRARRHYPLGTAAAHLMGYIGEVSEGEIENDPRRQMGDWTGRAGVELSLEGSLSGEKGRKDVLLDALGQEVRRVALQSPQEGSRITLTIDADLQKWAQEAFHDSFGALVALEPATGKILALYSAPAYDPNIFVSTEKSRERRRVLEDTIVKPLFNRALMATYSPGSTFKTVTMISGLMSGKLSRRTRFSCSGMHAGMKCWKDGGHGSLDLVGAYQNSCNVYFYQAGERIWIEPIYRTAWGLGLDQYPEFGLGPEEHGVVPTPEWERTHVKGPDGEHWGTGDVRNTAIGQGYVEVTPAQMARLAASVANKGKRMKPMLVERIESVGDSRTLLLQQPQVENDLGLDSSIVEIVRDGMKAVVAAGTGRKAAVAGITVGGKTGTAQTPHGADHAWFICVAPVEDPKIAMCVFVEHAGMGGGKAAAPIASYVIERLAKREGWVR